MGDGGIHKQRLPRECCAEHSIAIDAPIDTVWSILADFGSWGSWNPLYIETDGTLEVGRQVGMTVALAGLKPQKALARVSVVNPPTRIEYGLRNLGGLLCADRYIDLEPTGPGSCRVANGEIMSGLLGKLMFRFMGGKVRDGLQGMNEALQRRSQTG